MLQSAAEHPKFHGVCVCQIDRRIPPGVAAAFGVVEDFFWLIFVAVPCGPLIELMLRSSAELQKFFPVLFEKVQNAGNHGVLLCFRLTKSIAVDVNMKATSPCLMARVTHLHGLSQDGCPRHFCLMVGERHGVRHHLEAIIQ